MHFLITLFVIINIFCAISCGFRLQSKSKIPEELKTLKLNSDDPYGIFTRTVKEQLLLNEISLVNEDLQNTPILKIISLSEKIKNISLYKNGIAIEKELKFLINAEIILPNGNIYPIKTVIKYIFFDNQLETLAKDNENSAIKQEIYKQAANQLINKLLIIYSTISNKNVELITTTKTSLEYIK